MSQPPDDDDQIFSGKALGEDGALQPARPIPLLHEVAPPAQSPASAVPGGSLLDDPAYEPTVISIPPRVREVADRHAPVELAETRPPPMSSDYVSPPPERPVRYGAPDLRWGVWLLRAAVVGLVVTGVWAVTSGKISVWKGFSLDLLRSEPKKKEEAVPKRVGTPAPTLLVLSEPAGATVLVAGTEVGLTPWAGDNVWPSREPLRIEVRKAGYQPWVGIALGGQQATLEANLRKR
ncbi:MAG TPA: PEGA domain-containing protein [Myxococcaceae bacterium]|nr:PEGA domain-containing protein [Myxococcaceae bacterium]